MRRVEVWSWLVGLSLPACIFVSDFDGLTDGPPHEQDAANDAVDGGAEAEVDSGDAPACTNTQFQLCSTVPAAPPGFAQVVDGLDNEFCQVPAHIFHPLQGSFQTCGTDADFVDTADATVTTRMVWSSSGIHLFIHAQKDPSIPIVTDPTQLYKGDAVEFLFANRAAPTGNLATDQAVQLIIAPPLPDGGSGYLSSIEPFTSPWVAVRANGGYDVELEVPWSMLGGPTPTSQLGVVLNLGIDIAGPNGERYQSFVHYTLPDGGAVFCKDTSKPTPSENTLTWCASKLQ